MSETMTENMKYWRSVQYQEWTNEYKALIKDEFQAGDSEFTSLQRRDMLKLMGASFALAGLGAGCRRPVDKIMPYSKAPEGTIPGIPKYFATTRPSVLGAMGLVVETHEGRPTKIEGNELHPASLGAASIHDQAAVLELYDPDRSKVPTKPFEDGRIPGTWDEWDAFASDHFNGLVKKQGDGFAFVFGGEESKTLERLQKEILLKYPKAVFYTHNPILPKNSREGAEKAFGAGSRVLYRFEKAKVILSVQADPLMNGAQALVNARGFAAARKIYKAEEASGMNRLYAVEAGYSLTGTNADHRLPLAASQTPDFLKALAHELLPEKFAAVNFSNMRFLKALAKDLSKNKGQALIVMGENQVSELHALVHCLNHALDGQGKVFEVAAAPAVQTKNMADLVVALNKNQVQTLVMMGVNPVYSTPESLGFKDALRKAKILIHMGLYEDESAQNAHWHLPVSHFLESWGDAKAFDGTASLIQPMIAPLHNTRSDLEILAQIAQLDSRKGLDLVKASWAGINFEQALHDGVIPNTAYAVSSKTPVLPSLSASKSSSNIEILFNLDNKTLDGRYANLSWMQELADPVTKLTWGNAILVSQALSKELGINSRVTTRIYEADVVSVTLGSQSIEAPAFIMPGLADKSVVVSLGYGRENSGIIGNGVGVNFFKIMPADFALTAQGVQIVKTGKIEKLASTQEQFAMNADAIQEVSVLSLDNRDPAKLRTAQEFAAGAKIEKHPLEQLTDAWKYTGNKWGMVIDLSSCTGCNACVTACQSENNIPVVGKDQVMRSRALQWIRVDRYFTGDVSNPQSIAQPVPCMHCENAPCEPVCPVAATVHDTEGLNTMIYNRCVGTRYCGNNCPYKVRRFNYLDYSNSGNIYINPLDKERNTLLQMQKNPDVTIRYRGVMEKCTYCTQRVQEAKIAAKRDQTDSNHLPDGAVTPACAQTCPTKAITFGNLNDDQSRVSILKNSERNYNLLEELNTRPRTSYLAKLRNPNLELA
ncbi:MAG: Fe-S-cluster-containing hydrogenase [Myxococcaceae bacterium]